GSRRNIQRAAVGRGRHSRAPTPVRTLAFGLGRLPTRHYDSLRSSRSTIGSPETRAHGADDFLRNTRRRPWPMVNLYSTKTFLLAAAWMAAHGLLTGPLAAQPVRLNEVVS